MRHTLLFVFVATLACSKTSMIVLAPDAGGGVRSPDMVASVDAAPDVPPCKESRCLGGHKYLFQINRVWKPGGAKLAPSGESDYQPTTDQASYLLSFSPDGEAVVVAKVTGNHALQDGVGAVTGRGDQSVLYRIENNWAGAELIVSFRGPLGAEISVFGSGLPIVESTRGTMTLTEAYAPVGDTCALDPVEPYDGYLPTAYDDVLAIAGATPVTCAGIRDGYCGGNCAGWLVAILPWRDPPIAAAYDPVTRILVGWKTGVESYGICRGTFPPPASDGNAGWNPAKMDRSSGCP